LIRPPRALLAAQTTSVGRWSHASKDAGTARSKRSNQADMREGRAGLTPRPSLYLYRKGIRMTSTSINAPDNHAQEQSGELDRLAKEWVDEPDMRRAAPRRPESSIDQTASPCQRVVGDSGCTSAARAGRPSCHIW
jgi:hypothetical protein